MVESMLGTLHHKHKRSAKEKVTGHDTAPLMDGKIPLGKIHQTEGKNFTLLKTELLGPWKLRDEAKHGQALTPDETDFLNRQHWGQGDQEGEGRDLGK